MQCPRITSLPKLPWASQLFIQFLTKRGEPFTRETKSWISPCSRVTLFWRYGHPPSRTNFSLYQNSSSPSGVNSIKANNQSMRERCWQLFSHINIAAIKLTRLEGWPFFPWTTFLHLNRPLGSVISTKSYLDRGLENLWTSGSPI